MEKSGIVHAPIGKLSFAENKLVDNLMALVEQVVKQKPPSAKGTYLASMTLTSTMGPGIRLDPAKAHVAKEE